MGFDFTVIAPLLLSHDGFSFVFGCGVSFLVSSTVFLSMIVQQLFVILVFPQEGVRACPSTPPSWFLILISLLNTFIHSFHHSSRIWCRLNIITVRFKKNVTEPSAKVSRIFIKYRLLQDHQYISVTCVFVLHTHFSYLDYLIKKQKACWLCFWAKCIKYCWVSVGKKNRWEKMKEDVSSFFGS